MAIQVRHQLGTAQIDERPDDVLTTRMNRGQAAGPGAAHEAQQHGLCLIVARVPDGDDVGLPALADTLEKCVAHLARRLFQRTATPRGDFGDVTEFDVESHPAVFGQARAELGVAIGVGAAQAVVQVGQPGEVNHAGGRQFRHQQCQRDRVGPAGHGDDHARAVATQRPASDGRQHASGKRGHDRRRASGLGLQDVELHELQGVARRRVGSFGVQTMVPVQGLEPRTPRI